MIKLENELGDREGKKKKNENTIAQKGRASPRVVIKSTERTYEMGVSGCDSQCTVCLFVCLIG